MTAEKWTHRVRPEAAAGDLEKLKAVAEELAQHAKRAPGRTGLVFQNVAQGVLLGTAFISGLIGLVHLVKELTRKGHEQPHRPLPAEGGDGRRPPPRRHQACGSGHHSR
jgi:hypothetical protein